LTNSTPIPYCNSMIQTRIRIVATTLLSILALASILMAPVAALSHQGMTDVVSSAAADADCDGCHHGAADSQQDDCCTTSACACACHAPLTLKAIDVPLPLATASSFNSPTPQAPPQVYLSIFVPPQNRF